MIAYHEISKDLFDALAGGLGGAEAVSVLAAAQCSKRMLLLRHIVQAQPQIDAVTDALIKADRTDRRVIADLMGDPLVGTWITRTVRTLIHDAGARVAPTADLAQIGTLAAAAALRTGQDACLTTWALDGRVTLPTIGTALVGAEVPVTIEIHGGSAVLSGPGAVVRTDSDDPRWFPLRRISSRHGAVRATVSVEDGNPYRNCYHAPPAGRLDELEVDRWRTLFDVAWAMLVRHRPERAAELSAGMRALVPLTFETGDMARSGTAHDSFGAMGLTTPHSALDFAITLVHEFQHSKLSGLLDLVPLTVPGGRERHFAPWRVDPRPTTGLLQGTYAFLGIADTWRGLRAEPQVAERAVREFAHVRRQVDAGVTALERSTELTERGRIFVTALRDATDRMLAEFVPAGVAEEAGVALAENRRAWAGQNRVVSAQ